MSEGEKVLVLIWLIAIEIVVIMAFNDIYNLRQRVDQLQVEVKQCQMK